ncbi:ethanolamine utilization protein EutL [Enterococcus sp. PF1-24]|uniref:ethanolamine utilization microcompartment protein EutL n=1 Tax=unclassified Enterococcus TaxID=2608891 RepID=UPI0024744F37|nr:MULTISPECIES: ethanolamine utilization microcompartment protein EutL [unclassified Enterococcus]MDH6364916.1 ethanolamine utilization protein EutL [Enterococcus sp. PFB1-1]MDH6402017.1 ethanolamine utilization protein EutL [Enterococcus sp. PF1-24]
MRDDLLKAKVLSMKIITNADESLIKQLELKENQRSLGIVTADTDDVTYVALDEATKTASVEVVYAKSMYAGSANANSQLAGDVIGVVAGPNPAEVASGLARVAEVVENEASFISANADDTIVYFAHVISRSGSFLSKEANINEGESIAYLIAPPLEAIYGLDAALKAADVKMGVFYGPPSETNFGGALLYGSQSACKAACNAFAQAIQNVADKPLDI